jgi:hypothetical protein
VSIFSKVKTTINYSLQLLKLNKDEEENNKIKLQKKIDNIEPIINKSQTVVDNDLLNQKNNFKKLLEIKKVKIFYKLI